MKNLLTLFTMLLLCIGSTWAQDLDRSGWTILASSACDDGGSGQVNALTDGSTTTFWHSRWGDGHAYGDTNGGCPHAIQIDLGSVQEFNGIRISNRTDQLGNGRVAGYEVYVSDTPFATSASGFRANEVKGDAAPVLSGTFTNTAQGAVNMAGSKTKLSGQYVLFVITSSVNQSSTYYACIAEVNLFSIPDGSNAYIGTYNGTSNAVDQTKWQTEANWITTGTWKVGPGYSNSDMWSPIYLKDVTATGISFEGWNLRIKLVNSSLTATTNKLQTGSGSGDVTKFDVDRTSALDLTLQPATGQAGNDPGTHTFNIDGRMTIKTVSGHFAGSSTNTVNLGTTGHFTFKADATATVTIGNNARFTLNAIPVDPSAENTPESRTLATFTNVTVSSLTVTIDGTDGWTQVASQAALQQQFYNGKYYCVEKNNSSGVTLYTFRETRRTTHTVTSDATLSQIDSYDTYDNFSVNSGVTLTVDVENFDITRISGAGNVVLDVDASLTGSKSTAATGKLTVNAGKTLTIGSHESETNSVESFTRIDLLGEIYHKNSAATLNNVTVPAGATGIIYSYDMGSAANGFLLAGTTTVEGTLFVCNKWNFQMKVDQLTGSGTWTICGTGANDFDAEGTNSTEAATVNVASATSFTGSATVRNNRATVNVAGNLAASTWTKTNGTLNYTGTNLAGTTLDGAILASGGRINTSGVVSIRNLAGNNNTAGSNDYAFVGSGTISFYGTCDLTKKADGTTVNRYSKLGYGSTASIVIKDGAIVTAGGVFNSKDGTNNAPITIETGGKLIVPGTAATETLYNGYVRSTTFTNNGTLELNAGANISAISGTGTVTVPEGVTATVASIANTATLTGAGNLVLGTFPTKSAPTLTEWTGTVEFPAVTTSQGNLTEKFNAWGNASSTVKLNNTQGYLNKGETVSPVLNLAGTLTIVDGYSGTDNPSPVLRKVTGAGTLALTWTPNKVYCIEITELSDFTGTLQGHAVQDTYIRINVGKYTVASAPYPDTKLFNASGDVTLQNLYIGLQQTTAYTWTLKTVDDVSGFYVESVDQVQLAREDAINTIMPYYNCVGTGVGKYTVRLNNVDYTDINQIEAPIQAWNLPSPIPVIITINQPTSGYYRILNKGTQRYVNCTKVDDDEATHTSADITGDDAAMTIFYIDEDKNIQAYDNGAYWKGVYRMGRGTFDGGDFGELTYKHPWQFIEGNTLGTYKLIYGNDTEGMFHATGSGESTDHADVGSAAADADAATWTLVAVTELPDRTEAGSTERGNEITYAPAGTIVPATVPNVLVSVVGGGYQCNNLQLTDDITAFETPTIFTGTNVTYNRATSANQWGTICLPYAVSTDGDVAYYRLASTDSEHPLRFERVTGPTTTAYEPYLIKKTADAGLTISASDAGFTLGNPAPQEQYDGFKLKGTMVSTSVIDGTTKTEAKDGYQQAVTDPNAYYFEASSNTFRALNGRFNLKAFRAYLTATFKSSDSARSILGIDISEDGQATGISFVESEDGKTVDVVFDLNGRRLQEARKGINIINGKKVIK